MKYSERAEVFRQLRSRYLGLLTSVLWKLTGDRELFAEAMQNALLGMWQNVEKLNGEKVGAYIYWIALTANPKAWRNRIGRDGQISRWQMDIEEDPAEQTGENELAGMVRRTITLKEFRIVLSDWSEDAEMHFNVGVLLEQQGKIDEAISQYRQALEINPAYDKARSLPNAALAKQDKRKEKSKR
jgi:tetratricopeptide (TPR) repeat protein